MSEESLVSGKVNVEKYMSLLQSESDLKVKLQQLFLKMKKTEAEDKAEITRLTELLNNQNSNSSEDKSDVLKMSANMNSLKMDLETANAKLKSCRSARVTLEEDLQAKESQIKALLATQTSTTSNKSTTKKKPATKKPASKATSKKSKSRKDDLTLISGVGPKLKEKLYREGITQFEQIAVWKAADIRDFDDKLSFKGRIKRDEWVKQAKALMKK